MLASQKFIDAINQQVGNEMGASMQYIQIASYFESEYLPAACVSTQPPLDLVDLNRPPQL